MGTLTVAGERRHALSLDQRVANLPAALLAAGAAAIWGLALAGVLLHQRGPTPGPVWMTVTLAASFWPLAIFVLRRVPGHPLGRLMFLTGTTATIATLAVCWSALLPAAWLSQWIWWPPVAIVPLLLLFVPDGHLPSPRWRVLAAILIVSLIVAAVALAAAATSAPRTLLTDIDQPIPPAARLLVQVAVGCVVVLLLATLAVLSALLHRWHMASVVERHQLACLLPSAALLIIGILLDYLHVPAGWLAAVVALPLGLTFAILQYHLYDLDLYIYRGIVWLILTGLALAIYALVVTGVEQLLNPERWTSTLVAGAAVAAILLPAERWVQRAVSRLLYGSRTDPYSVLTRIGRHTEAVADPLAVLPRFVATLVESLRVPYAAIVLKPAGNEAPLMVQHGRSVGEPQRFPMMAHGVDVGELLVASRRPGAHFSASEARLLSGLAGQAGIAAEACRSTLDLQRAREQLVLAREEERRRLRRDLHDGVASALVGARFLASAARGMPELLDQLDRDLEACTEEVRDLIDGLRPAALDKGLEAALRDLAARMPDPSIRVTVRVKGQLTDLTAAIEVVAYRVVAEALTNVVKHAKASRCDVLLAREERSLSVCVTDDGVGLSSAQPSPGRDPRGGVGVGSLRSRVEEVGGSFSIEPRSSGVCVKAVLPTATIEPSPQILNGGGGRPPSDEPRADESTEGEWPGTPQGVSSEGP
ncbi:MAG: hypothetical protein QOF52_2115 [Propionibacteriaceae bacterium]|nr:hypothetical protein [Propionibacteriaceae bacterium]